MEVNAAGTPSKQEREEAVTLVTGLAKKHQSTDENQHKETVRVLAEKQTHLVRGKENKKGVMFVAG